MDSPRRFAKPLTPDVPDLMCALPNKQPGFSCRAEREARLQRPSVRFESEADIQSWFTGSAFP